MKIRPAVVCGLGAAALFATISSAAPAPQVVDQPGDANAVSGQGLHPDAPTGFVGPGSQDQYDILSMTLEPIKKRSVCTGFTATVEFKGTPKPDDSMHRVRAKTAANPTFFLLQFQKDAVAGERTSVRVAGGEAAKTVTTEKPATVVGNKIIWTISLKDLAQVGENAKTSLDMLGADSGAGPGGALFLPIFDLARSDKSVKVCG